MDIRRAVHKDKQAWDTYVHSRQDAAPYSLFAWKQAVEEAYGHKSCYLLAEDRGKICGILPCFIFHVPFIGNSLVSLPFCDVGDVLADNDDITKALLAESMAVAEKVKANKVMIRSTRGHLPATDLCSRHVSVQTGKVRILLDLPSSSEELWKGFKSKLRSQVNKAEKNGLSFHWGTLEDLDKFYHVFSRNMHALGSPVHSKEWIEKIIAHYGEYARMGLVFKEDIPVGCGIILCTKQRVSIPWASTLREYNRLSPNMMLYWNFLKYAADHNKQVFDFGRSTPDEGTYRFKKQWGAVSEPLYWYRLTQTESPEDTKNTTSTKREQIAVLWSKMPLSLANVLGPKIRKYISL